MGGGEHYQNDKRGENFNTCILISLKSPVPSTGQFFPSETAYFLFHCAQPKKASILSMVIRIECKKNRVLTGYELIYCILKTSKKIIACRLGKLSA